MAVLNGRCGCGLRRGQVLGSVMSDKSLDKFRQEYEKLHQALKKVGSHRCDDNRVWHTCCRSM